MAVVNLANAQDTIDASRDSIVIVDNFQSIRGGRSLLVTGFIPPVIKAGHIIIQETATGEYKPMPATDAEAKGVATLGAVTPGSGYAVGTYENVPLSGGTGTGVLATVVVITGGTVSTITVTKAGKGYTVGDVLSVLAAFAGGTGSGASAPVATTSDVGSAYGALPGGHTYAGVNISSILTSKAFSGIMVRGTVNHIAGPFSMTTILAAVKAALPLIDFRAD